MKIADIQTVPVTMPKDDPYWRIALGVFPESHGMVVKVLTDNGINGYGYLSLQSPVEHLDAELMKAVLREFTRNLVGQNPMNIEKLLCDLDRIPFPGIEVAAEELGRSRIRVKSTIDVALHDIVAKVLGVPVYQLLGGLVREEVPILRIMPIKEPEETARTAVQIRDSGYRYIKIKLEGNPRQDVRRVKLVREAVGPDVHLTVDANQSYSVDAGLHLIGEIEKYAVDLVEQPVPAGDLEGLAEISLKSSCRIEAHESADTPQKVLHLLEIGFTGSFNVSVTHGGLRALRNVVSLCRLAGAGCVVSCVGPRLLSAACLHFVVSCADIDYACQLGEFVRLLNDPSSGLDIHDGKLRVPSTPGLGVHVNV